MGPVRGACGGGAGERARLAPLLTPVEQAVGLHYDHDRIVRLAVEWLRGRYRSLPDADGLLPAEFALRDLQLLHEAALGGPVMKDAFRRGMVEGLVETGRLTTGSVRKPAQLWRRNTDG